MTLLFLPPLLLSLISTLNFHNKSSLKILYRQPSLIILPTVTFFTFSRHNIGYCCCGENNQVSFSKKFTWLNITISTVGYVVWLVWAYFHLGRTFGFIWLHTISIKSFFSLLSLPSLSVSSSPPSPCTLTNCVAAAAIPGSS